MNLSILKKKENDGKLKNVKTNNHIEPILIPVILTYMLYCVINMISLFTAESQPCKCLNAADERFLSTWVQAEGAVRDKTIGKRALSFVSRHIDGILTRNVFLYFKLQ